MVYRNSQSSKQPIIEAANQTLALLAVFVYATHATQSIACVAFGWKPGLRRLAASVRLCACLSDRIRHRLSGISTYGLNGLGKGDEHLAYAPLE